MEGHFLVPDYYEDFRCKGGACRRTCCDGWGISVTQAEYFRLLGLDCPPDLRRRIDVAFHAPETPSPERFRLITPTWQGDCPMRAPDGLCALQCACGEEALPAICRLYPRAPRTAFALECSCSGSCERVIEMLMAHKEKMTFHTVPLHFEAELPHGPELRRPQGYYNAVRQMCLEMLQKRELPLRARLMRLCSALRALTPQVSSCPPEDGERRIRYFLLSDAPPAAVPEGLDRALSYARALSRELGENSVSLSSYTAAAEQALPDEPAWTAAAQRFANLFPDWETEFEQMLVNHLFYDCFPFSDVQENLAQETQSLAATYALLRFLTVGYAQQHPTREDYVDAAAAAFRLIEHSRFDHNAAVVLRHAGCESEAALFGLLQI